MCIYLHLSVWKVNYLIFLWLVGFCLIIFLLLWDLSITCFFISSVNHLKQFKKKTAFERKCVALYKLWKRNMKGVSDEFLDDYSRYNQQLGRGNKPNARTWEAKAGGSWVVYTAKILSQHTHTVVSKWQWLSRLYF